MSFLRQFIEHISKIITAQGKKRIVYSLVNVLFIAIAVLAGWGFVKAIEMIETSLLGAIIILIVCIATVIYSLINGIIGQIIMLIKSLIQMFNKEERKYALPSFIIALLSLCGMVVAIVMLV